MARSIRYTLLALLLAGCAALATQPPTSEALPLLVTTPAIQPWVVKWATAYAEVDGPLPFDVETRPPEAALAAAEDGAAGLVLAALEPPAGWFATPMQAESIAVIVHPDNHARSFSTEQLADLFSGRIASWDALNGEPIAVQPVIPLAGDEVRQRFEALVLEGMPPTSNALLAPSPSIMLELVSEHPGAIGFLLDVDIPRQVSLARVEGALPSSAGYPLKLQILAFSPAEPTGPLRDWLIWLQASE